MAVQKTPNTSSDASTTRATPVSPKPAAPARGTGSGSRASSTPASGFQSGAPGLGNKFGGNAVLRTGRFANRASGADRATLALNFETTVGGAIERFGEHLENPENPTGRDLALLNQPFDVIG